MNLMLSTNLAERCQMLLPEVSYETIQSLELVQMVEYTCIKKDLANLNQEFGYRGPRRSVMELVVDSLREIFTYTTWKSVDRSLIVKRLENVSMQIDAPRVPKHECLQTAQYVAHCIMYAIDSFL